MRGKDYEIAAGYNIEYYNDPAQYPNGVQDDAYYSEIWIPVKKKDDTSSHSHNFNRRKP